MDASAPAGSRPWMLRMTWEHLLFAHWPVDAAAVAAKLPAGLEVDTFDGRAWLGVVPFLMSGVRVRGLPPLPTARRFPELNVRTYVRCRGASGVWFFSLDAASSAVVIGARASFALPYFRAEMTCEEHDGAVRYESRRLDGTGARFAASYRPTSPVRGAPAGSLERWLTARFALFSARAGGTLLRGDIEHEDWPLQDAEAEIEVETVSRAAGFEPPRAAPLLHFARRVDVLALAPRSVGRPAGPGA